MPEHDGHLGDTFVEAPSTEADASLVRGSKATG